MEDVTYNEIKAFLPHQTETAFQKIKKIMGLWIESNGGHTMDGLDEVVDFHFGKIEDSAGLDALRNAEQCIFELIEQKSGIQAEWRQI